MTATRLKLHGYPDSPYCSRVQFFCELAEIPYDYVKVDIASKQGPPASYRSISPFAMVPAIKLGEDTLFDSLAILEFLAETFTPDRFLPAGGIAKHKVKAWMHVCCQEIGEPLSILAWERFWTARFDLKPNLANIEKNERRLYRSLPVLEQKLSRSKFVASNSLTLADIALLPLMECKQRAEVDLANWPATDSWLNQLTTYPAWKAIYSNL